MPDDVLVIVVSFALAGLIAGMFAVWILRINRRVYAAMAERRIAQRVEEWLRRF